MEANEKDGTAGADGPMGFFGALVRQGCLNHPVGEPVICETHMGYVFLAGDFAYKMRKPTVIDLVDYSTPDRRARYLRRELALNRIFGHDLHIEVVPAYLDERGRPALIEHGEPVDYLLKMRRLPTESLLSVRVSDGHGLSPSKIARLAKVVASFHEDCDPVPQRWEERLQKIVDYACESALRSQASRNMEDLTTRISAWCKTHQALLATRAVNGFVRDIHGDLKLEHVFFEGDRFYIFDRLEFDEELRQQDVALDIAALVADLLAWDQSLSAEKLVATYATTPLGQGIDEVLPFFVCLRALLSATLATTRSELGQEVPGGLATSYLEIAVETDLGR